MVLYTSKKLTGFTLIELLVVISIIAILAAILFPVFARVREKARQTSCASNERQLGQAFQQYVNDYDETYPISAEPHNNSTCGYGWAGRVFPYVKSTGIYQCPDDITAPTSVVVSGATYQLSPVSYAYNGAISGASNLLGLGYGHGIDGKASMLNSPVKTVLLLEVGSNSSNTEWVGLAADEAGLAAEQYAEIPASPSSGSLNYRDPGNPENFDYQVQGTNPSGTKLSIYTSP